MIERPINSCSKESCHDCNIHSSITCHTNPGQLLRFYLILLPPIVIGATGIYNYSINSFVGWVLIIGLFFLLFGIRVLCTHCPHYNESKGILRCWANYGVPKFWRYRPGPMNNFEKTILLSGFAVIWTYPIIFIFLTGNWILMAAYVCSVILFFALLNHFSCRKCINLTCPLNSVDIKIKEEFLKNNPSIYESWEKTG